VNSWARLAVGTITTGVAAVAYGAGIERRRWTLRTATLPVLAEGARPLRVLHISDLHLTPGQDSKKRWVAALAELEPDLVVNTGDNLAHPRAVPGVLAALDPLLSRPGVFVFGSNDYFGPRPKNPARYLVRSERRIQGEPLPWRDLRAAMTERGWSDVTHTRVRLEVDGMAVAVAGVDDPHLGLDPFPRAERARPVRRRRLRPRAGRPHPRRAAADARGGSAGHQLRHRPLPGPWGVPLGIAHVAARVGRARHLTVRPGAVRLPAGGQPADPGAAPGGGDQRRGNPPVGGGGRRIE
jgi:uncharacterized protein